MGKPTQHVGGVNEETGYVLTSAFGTLCQCPANVTEVDAPQRISVKPFVGMNDPLYYATGTTVKGIAMQNGRKFFRNLQTVPNPFIANVEHNPNYERRYTVLPTPPLGLFGIKDNNE